MNSNFNGYNDYKYNKNIDNFKNYADKLEYEYKQGINYFEDTKMNSSEFSEEFNNQDKKKTGIKI